MSKKDNYILVTWHWDESSDYVSHHSFETEFSFVTEKQLDNLVKLMEDNGIKRWVKDPHSVNAKNWKSGDGSLVEYRNLEVKPVRFVESWSYKPEQVNK